MQKYHMPLTILQKPEVYLDYKVELNYLGCSIQLEDKTETEVSESDISPTDSDKALPRSASKL